MAFALQNHRPVELSPEHLIPLVGDYDPLPAAGEVLVQPLRQSLSGQSPAVVLDAKGSPVGDDQLLSALMRGMSTVSDPAAEADLKDLYRQALVDYTGTSHLSFGELFPVQAQERDRQPHPLPHLKYLAQTDVIPAAKRVLSSGDDGALLYSLAYAYAPSTLGFWFLTEDSFDDFKAWMQQELAPIAQSIPGDTSASLGQFYGTRLDKLTEGLVLRAHDDDKLEPMSFARVVVHMLMKYSIAEKARWQASRLGGTASPSGAAVSALPRQAGVLPFDLGELFLPQTVVLVNAEMHAHSSAGRIDNEWALIQQSLRMRPTVIPPGRIAKLSALPRAMAKARQLAMNAAKNAGAPAGRSAAVRFRKAPPSKVQLLGGILRVLKRMGQVTKSQNSVRMAKSTYSRANRRRPDDPNIPGKSMTTKYMPDIHLYLDCSGSVSEDQYRDTVIELIGLAKKLNVNLYFSSFSHVLSGAVLLKTKDKSVKAIWNEFRRIPKVSGATDYEQIWHYINEKSARKRRFSLVITDFEWHAGSHRVEHPKNLYYAPLAGRNWKYMTMHAEDFVKTMQHNDPAIGTKLIGITV